MTRSLCFPASHLVAHGIRIFAGDHVMFKGPANTVNRNLTDGAERQQTKCLRELLGLKTQTIALFQKKQASPIHQGVRRGLCPFLILEKGQEIRIKVIGPSPQTPLASSVPTGAFPLGVGKDPSHPYSPNKSLPWSHAP